MATLYAFLCVGVADTIHEVGGFGILEKALGGTLLANEGHEVVFAVDFFLAKGDDFATDGLFALHHLIGIGGEISLDFHVEGGSGSVFPEVLAIEAVDVVPRLNPEVIVDDADIGGVDSPLLEGLAVPALGKSVGFVLADDV